MRTQSITEQDTASAIAPPIRPQARWRVAHVQPLKGFRLRVRFVDGLEGMVDMAALVSSPKAGVFAHLAQPSLFDQVFLEHGAVTWPGEIDLAPDALYAEIKKAGEWRL